MKRETNKTRQRVLRTTLLAILALVLPVVAGCRSCEGGGACAIATSEAGKTFSKTGPAVVSTATLSALLESGTPLILLDARSGKYDDGRRIPGARSLNAKSSAKEIAQVVKTKDTLVVTYCSNLKCPASGMLAERLLELGYGNVVEYSVGIAGWAEAGKTVVKEKK